MRRYYQRHRKLSDILDTEVHLGPLDGADVVAMQSGLFGQLLLGPTTPLSLDADVFRDYGT